MKPKYIPPWTARWYSLWWLCRSRTTGYGISDMLRICGGVYIKLAAMEISKVLSAGMPSSGFLIHSPPEWTRRDITPLSRIHKYHVLFLVMSELLSLINLPIPRIPALTHTSPARIDMCVNSYLQPFSIILNVCVSRMSERRGIGSQPRYVTVTQAVVQKSTNTKPRAKC